VRVLGVDPEEADRDWRGRIGIVLQESRMHPELTVRETLELFAGYYSAPRPVGETIERVGLAPKTDDRVNRLSGGQQRRLDVALALIGDPELLFLDEPTTGFDPAARRRAWDLVADLRELGKTVFLTTHYMEEAQVLADRVAIIAGGTIVVAGTPDRLGERAATVEVRFLMPEGVRPDELPIRVDGDGRYVVVQTGEPVRVLNELTSWALARDVDLAGLQVASPSLEDIYLEFTEANPNPEPGR
jgi:ABC-2 type transport system ATP-binding protein